MWVVSTVSLVVFLIWKAIWTDSYEITSNEDAMEYLKMYGYLEDSFVGVSFSPDKGKQILTESIQMYQQFSGLEMTGNLDKETMMSMNKARCGMAERMDMMENKLMTRANVSHPIPLMKKRRRRGWRTSEIYYRITEYPRMYKSIGLDKLTVRKEIKRAFQLWEKEANLKCVELIGESERQAHINIRFAVGEHGDHHPFGRLAVGNVAAHAFFPDHNRHHFRGQIHFDDERPWTAFNFKGLNLYQTAAHEIGHALGLDHSRFPESVMHMYLKPQKLVNFTLHEDDIMGIRNLYPKTDHANNVNTANSNQQTISAVKPIIRKSSVLTSPSSTQISNPSDQVLGNFWRCVHFIYDPKNVNMATDCFTNMVSNIVISARQQQRDI